MLLETKALTKTYERGGKTFAAVAEVSFSLNENDFACVTGPSGSGKSTLLGLVSGLLTPTTGQVHFAGENLSAQDDSAAAALRNSKIGYIPQGHSILANFTVLENVCLPFYLGKRTGDPVARAQELLAQMGVSHLSAQYPVELSGGELRRVSIARGLINAPQLVVADEPTADLDPQNSESVMSIFAAIAEQGTAVLLVTHEFENLRHCNRHFRMSEGEFSEVAT